MFRLCLLTLCIVSVTVKGQVQRTANAILALYTAKNDHAHISFVKEANEWFSMMARENRFIYKASQDWTMLHADTLAKYNLVIFLDSRPDSSEQRMAFETYIKQGGAWMGFHFAGFALSPSMYPQNWPWYHNEFLGSGQYVSNTWRPTSAILQVEDRHHAITKGMPGKFKSSPNEWYRWETDLRENPDIRILVSIHPSSFPLGTGPKLHEIWHEGYYPVVWTNERYRMVYFNMGHNDIDYEGKTNRELSRTFGNKVQDQLVWGAVKWLTAKPARTE